MRKHQGARKLAVILAFAMVLTSLFPAGRVDAASKYFTEYNSKYGKGAQTSTKTGLNQVLGNKKYKAVYLKNKSTAKAYTIQEGTYKQRLWVNAPKSDVKNYGKFQMIKIMDIKENTWREYAKGNSLAVTAPNPRVVIENGASVKKLYLQADNAEATVQVKGEVKKLGIYGENTTASLSIRGDAGQVRVAAENAQVKMSAAEGSSVERLMVSDKASGSKVTMNVNSEVKEIVLDSNATLVLNGNTEKVLVTATENAEGAKIQSSVPVETKTAAKIEMTLNAGAEGSTLTKSDEKLEVAVKNNTEMKIEVGTEGSDKTETVNAGETVTTGGDAKDEAGDSDKKDETGDNDKKDEAGDSDKKDEGSTPAPAPAPNPNPNPAPDTRVALTEVSITSSGALGVGTVLTATVLPANATATFKWYRGADVIAGETGSTYTIKEADKGYAVKVAATGSGNYKGMVTSALTGVIPCPVEGVTIEVPENKSALVSGDAITLTAKLVPEQATERNVVWSVVTGAGFDGSAVLSSQSGESTNLTVTGTTGEVTVTATGSEKAGSYKFSVVADADAAELANKKSAALAEIEAMVKTGIGSNQENDYTKDTFDALSTAVTSAETAINTATDVSNVESALTTHRTAVDNALKALVRAFTVTFYVGNTECAIAKDPNKRVADETPLTVPADPTKAEDNLGTYEFAGWSTNKDATPEDSTVQASEALSGTAITANLSYYAIFRNVPKSYTVSWYAGDHSTVLATASAVAGTMAGGSQYPTSAETPTKASISSAVGYKLVGWSTTQNETEPEDLSQKKIEADISLYPVFELDLGAVKYTEVTMAAPTKIHTDGNGKLFANYHVVHNNKDIDFVLPAGDQDGIVEMWVTVDTVETQVVSGGKNQQGSGWEFESAGTADANAKQVNLSIQKYGGKTIQLKVITTDAAYKVSLTVPTAEGAVQQAEGINTQVQSTKVQQRKHAFGQEDIWVTFAIYKDSVTEADMYVTTDTAIAMQVVTAGALEKLVYLQETKWPDQQNGNTAYQMLSWYKVTDSEVTCISSQTLGYGQGSGDDDGSIVLHDIMLNMELSSINKTGRTYYAVVQERSTKVLYKIIIPVTTSVIQ